MFKRVNKDTMSNLILAHLREHGSVSNMEAQARFRCRALPKRVAELKALGHPITSIWKIDTHGQRYTRYFLDPPVQAAL